MCANLKSFAFMEKSAAPASLFAEKIDRDDFFGNFPADSGDRLVFRVNRITVESFAICKDGDKPRVERPVEIKNIGTDVKTLNVRDEARQCR